LVLLCVVARIRAARADEPADVHAVASPATLRRGPPATGRASDWFGIVVSQALEEAGGQERARRAFWPAAYPDSLSLGLDVADEPRCAALLW
jgi:hypothetical protein